MNNATRKTVRLAILGAGVAAASATITQAQPGGPCGAYESVPTPGQGEAGKVLTAIAARGDSGLAIGRDYPQGSGPFVPLLYRYDGAAWFEQDLPDLPGPATDPVLMSVAMSASTGRDAWVVGYVTVPPTTNNLPLIARWRDGSFDRVDTPELRPETVYPYGRRGGFAYDVVVLADDDIWAVGQAGGFGDAATSSVAMALHFDGSEWEETATQIVANRSHRFDAVSASATDDVWAVGASRSIAGAFLGFIQRWDGSSWNVVAHPALSIPQSQFHEVLALGPDEVWVAGAINYTDPLLYRWDGSSWQTMPLPAGSAVIALGGTASDDVWATTAGDVVSIFHWDGAGWAEIDNPPPPAGQIDSARGLAVAGPCDVWVAGSQMNATGFHGTFIEHLTPSPGCAADWNGDGIITSDDFFVFLTDFFAGNADFDGDGAIDSNDYFAFLSAFFKGC